MTWAKLDDQFHAHRKAKRAWRANRERTIALVHVVAAREAACIPCWACASDCDPAMRCPECDAPPLPRYPAGGSGVYVLQAQCGLMKIGWSGISARGRASVLQGESIEPLALLSVLDGAGRDIEKWLHRLFADVRDPAWARAVGLPNHTEWFWPTPALRRLVAGVEHMRDGITWEDVA